MRWHYSCSPQKRSTRCWKTSRSGDGPQCHQLLASAKIPHAIVRLACYQRNTVDVDLLIRKEDSNSVRKTLEHEEFTWNAKTKEFNAPSGVVIQCLLAGENAGTDSEVKLPDPGNARMTTEIEDLPVLTLAKLMESKIACGLGDIRRTHKDFADVVELIVANKLNSSFARFLHKSLRTTYRQ